MDNLTRFFQTALQRDLTADEREIIERVHALSPLEASQLLDYLAAGTRSSSREAPHA